MSDEISYGCQQNLINPDKELAAILEFICSDPPDLSVGRFNRKSYHS